jgi:hypothetical protein
MSARLRSEMYPEHDYVCFPLSRSLGLSLALLASLSKQLENRQMSSALLEPAQRSD